MSQPLLTAEHVAAAELLSKHSQHEAEYLFHQGFQAYLEAQPSLESPQGFAYDD